MKKFLTSRIFIAIITAIICITGTAYAASQILASDISYRDGTVESALNNLYDKANNYKCVSGIIQCDASCNNDTGHEIVDWKPTEFIVYLMDHSSKNVFLYNESYTPNVFNYHTGGIANASKSVFINDNKFGIYHIGINSGRVMYIACK